VRDLMLMTPDPGGAENGELLYFNNPEKSPPVITGYNPRTPFWLWKKIVAARTFTFAINTADRSGTDGNHLVLW
jgi:hypothetical protein